MKPYDPTTFRWSHIHERGGGVNWRSENQKEEMLGLLLIAMAVVLRLLPRFENFSPVLAVALFAGVALRPRVALTVPLLAMMISDIFKGAHSLMWLTWGYFTLMALWGIWVRRNPGAAKIFLSAIGGSVLFFVVSNLGVFFVDGMYPMTWEGLGRCFTLAIPLFRTSLLGAVLYVAALFGAFHLAKQSLLKPVPNK